MAENGFETVINNIDLTWSFVFSGPTTRKISPSGTISTVRAVWGSAAFAVFGSNCLL